MKKLLGTEVKVVKATPESTVEFGSLCIGSFFRQLPTSPLMIKVGIKSELDLGSGRVYGVALSDMVILVPNVTITVV